MKNYIFKGLAAAAVLGSAAMPLAANAQYYGYPGTYGPSSVINAYTAGIPNIVYGFGNAYGASAAAYGGYGGYGGDWTGYNASGYGPGYGGYYQPAYNQAYIPTYGMNYGPMGTWGNYGNYGSGYYGGGYYGAPCDYWI